MMAVRLIGFFKPEEYQEYRSYLDKNMEQCKCGHDTILISVEEGINFKRATVACADRNECRRVFRAETHLADGDSTAHLLRYVTRVWNNGNEEENEK